jgi:general secretion pathway protein K
MRSAVRRTQSGAALLTAMIIVALVATLASAMVWQQWRAVQIEAAERGRLQSAWLITGALDWARLMLRGHVRAAGPTALNGAWAVPLAEARLSTFLAADKNNTDGGPDAFLSGNINDVQARYNLRGLYDTQTQKVEPNQLAALRRLFQTINLAPAMADAIAEGLRDAQVPPGTPNAPQARPLMPEHLDQLVWLGIDEAAVRQMAPYVVLLPSPTKVNVNTAPKEVLAAMLEIGLGDAQRLVQHRQRTAFNTVPEVEAQLSGSKLSPQALALVLVGKSTFFEVRGRLRLDDRVLEESSVLEHRGNDFVTVSRKRESSRESTR